MKLDSLIVTAVKISRMLVVNNNLHVGCFICCYISTHTHTIIRLLSTVAFFMCLYARKRLRRLPTVQSIFGHVGHTPAFRTNGYVIFFST